MQPHDRVPFHRPTLAAAAFEAVREVLSLGVLTGGGARTAACHAILCGRLPDTVPFLTTSCTDALEMAVLLLEIRPGDEVVMPSWTFSSCANAVLLRGGVPVFVDVEPGTLNIDPARIPEALTPRTRAVLCVHYAGIACRMDDLRDLCTARGLALIEDAAQAFGSTWRGRALGGWGDLGAFSFHGTKNVGCGEGGALLVNRPDLVPRAEILWEKGTNRIDYVRNGRTHYDWVDIGSSFLPSEVTAAILEKQFEIADALTARRCAAWETYARLLAAGAEGSSVRMLDVPAPARHNGHIFAVRVGGRERRDRVMAFLAERGIETRTHYRPLHASPAAARHGRAVGPLTVSEEAGDGLIRLPLDSHITPAEQERVVATLLDGLRHADTVPLRRLSPADAS